MNIFYYISSVAQYKSDFLYIFNVMLIALVFLIPIMTMRIWSEEKKQKIDQLLLTAPVNTTDIVLGKFFAAMCVFLIALAFTLVYPLLSVIWGTPQFGIVLGNYIAIILAAGAYIAISQFMSSLTESQIISALLSMFTLSVFLLLNIGVYGAKNDAVSAVLSFLSIITRYTRFYSGIFSLADIVYFISLTVLFIFLTSRVIEKRRWS